jgi:hypothetical protein
MAWLCIRAVQNRRPMRLFVNTANNKTAFTRENGKVRRLLSTGDGECQATRFEGKSNRYQVLSWLLVNDLL